METINGLIKRSIPAGSFGRNVVTLMTGTTFAQLLLILVSPILTRLYSPDDFGIFALYASILGILSVVACWRYELAIVLPEKDEDAANLLALSVLICVGMATFTIVMIGIFRRQVADLLSAPDLANWLWLMPLSLLAVGLFQAFNYWSTRRKQFKRLAVRQITRSSVAVVTQIGLGTINTPALAGGLILGDLAGQVAASSRLAWQIHRDDYLYLKRISIKGATEQAIIYKEFPLYQIWAAILNAFSTMTPVLLLGYFFSPAIVGLYALGQKVVSSPMGIIGGSFFQVLFPQAELAHRQGTLDKLVILTFRQLLSIGLFPIATLAIIGPEIIGLFFGADWVQAGVYLRLLSPYLLFNFLSSPISSVFSILGKQKEYLIFNVVYIILATSALVYGGLNDDAQLAIALFGGMNFLLYSYFGALIFKMSGVIWGEVWSAVSPVLMNVIGFIIPILFIKFLIDQPVLMIVLCLTLTGAYFIYVFTGKRRINAL